MSRAASWDVDGNAIAVSTADDGGPDQGYAPNGVARFDLGAAVYAEAITLSSDERVALAGGILDGDEIDLVVAQAPYPVPEPHALAMIVAGVAGLPVLSPRR